MLMPFLEHRRGLCQWSARSVATQRAEGRTEGQRAPERKALSP